MRSLAFCLLLLWALLPSAEALSLGSRDGAPNAMITFCERSEAQVANLGGSNNEVETCQFQARSNWHFGFTKNIVWLKIEISKADKTAVLSEKNFLYIEHIYLSDIRVFMRMNDDHLQVVSTAGLNYPRKEWRDVLGGYSFPLASTNAHTVYLRVASKYPLSVPLQILTETQLRSRHDQLTIVLVFYFAFVLALMLYNSFLYLITREATFLYYVATILGLHMFTNLAQYGAIKGFLFPEWLWLHAHVFHIAHLFSLLPVFFFASQFFKESLKGRHLKVLRVLAFLTIPMALVGILTDSPVVDQLMQFNTTVFCIYLLCWTGSLAVRTRQRPAIYFFMAWSFLIVSWIINFFKISGFVPSIAMTDILVLIGSALECLLLSLAIADRIRVLTLEKNVAVSRLGVIEERNKIFRQVSHDIRSPVTALNMLAQHLDSIPEAPRLLLRSATSRINDIANQLLDRSRSKPALPAPGHRALRAELVSGLLEAIVSEKRVQLRAMSGVDIRLNLPSESYGLFSCVDSVELKRALSNLLSNSVEALPGGRGVVTVDLNRQSHGDLVIGVHDNGRGVPRELVPHLGQEGFSFGKGDADSGSGLGLYHAKQCIESFGGRLNIQSQQGTGSTVSIVLPISAPPAWFKREFVLQAGAKVVIVDDDSSVHRVWDQRLRDFKELQLLHFYSPSELRNWCKDGQADAYFVDYEFIGDRLTGLDLISGLGLSGKSVLVTSHFEDENIQALCGRLGVQMVPKGLVGSVPLKVDKYDGSFANRDVDHV